MTFFLPRPSASRSFVLSLLVGHGAVACGPTDDGETPANSGAASNSGGTTGTGGESTNPGSGGAFGSGGNSTGGGGTNSGGANPGAGGAANSGGADPGAGGSASGSGGEQSGAGGGGAVMACPADAWFCTGFEEAGMPAGTSYHPDYQADTWTERMSVQSATVFAGSQALEVTGADGYMWNVLSTPVQSSTFWARFYLRSTVEIGQAEHNSYVAAMTGDGEPNTGDNMEISEQYCQMVLNLHDKVDVTIGGSEQCGTGVSPLSKDEWHCVEVHFDGAAGTVQVFADDDPVIDSSGWDPLNYASFAFGYLGFHGPARTLWYDDIAVGPTRPGCP